MQYSVFLTEKKSPTLKYEILIFYIIVYLTILKKLIKISKFISCFDNINRIVHLTEVVIDICT